MVIPVEQVRTVQVVEATIAGVKNHVLSLVRSLDRDRFKVTVACPQVRDRAYGDRSFVEELHRLEVPCAIINLRQGIHPLSDAVAIQQLCQLLSRSGANVVHAHSTKAGLLARPAARLAGVPVVVYSPHAFAFAGAANPVARAWIIRVERALARWTDAVVCVSEGERQLALRARIAPREKLVVIHNGIEPSVFQRVSRAEARTNLEIEPGTPVIGFIGRLECQKGVSYLLQATARLVSLRASLLCLIVGDGALRLSLMREAEQLGIGQHVRFLGYRPDVPNILPALDVFVLPSLYEGLPYTVLEAMAAGIPVVATDVVGVGDVVRDGTTGLLVPPGDVPALSGAVQRILDDPSLGRRLALAGQTEVGSRFTLRETVSRLESLYLALMRAKKLVARGRLGGPDET